MTVPVKNVKDGNPIIAIFAIFAGPKMIRRVDGARVVAAVALSEPNWRGPYLAQELSADPWGHAYADGKPGGSGLDVDLVSWK